MKSFPKQNQGMSALPQSGSRDSIYSVPRSATSPFEFNSEVAHVFDDMISRSVPLYQEVQHACVQAAKRYYQAGSTIYDLGCSTGTTIALLANTLSPSTIVVGVDSSRPMLNRCKQKLDGLKSKLSVTLKCCDVADAVVQNASVIFLNYTLQFISTDQRLRLLRKIYQGLRKGGVLILTEKILADSGEVNDFLVGLHHQFKARSGYSELEIARKRDALENVLIPVSLSANLDLLTQAGFSEKELILRWYNFASILAKK